jgi:hypothetical protein
MKTTIERIFETLSKEKVELKSDKIELGLIDDALKYVKGVKEFGKNIDIDAEELEAVKRSIDVDVEQLETDLNALKKGMNEIEKTAKELGVKTNDIPKYKDAVDAVKYGEKQIEKGKSLIK